MGHPDFDEIEADFIDNDGDGDLDVFWANFSGTNAFAQNSAAPGLTLAGGPCHCNGTGISSAPWPAVPTSGNGGTTLDADALDMEGDGDPDLLLCNDTNQRNRCWSNRAFQPMASGLARGYAAWVAGGDSRECQPLRRHVEQRSDRDPTLSGRAEELAVPWRSQGRAA